MSETQTKRKKSPTIQVGDQTFLRIPVKTHIVHDGEDIVEIIAQYAGAQVQPGDIVVVSEKVVAITQGRAIPTDKIQVSWLARTLAPRVRRVPYGIGLGSPFSMQCAIDEVGAPRIVAAAVIGGFTRFFGRRGDFYRIAGMQAATIDAAGTAGIGDFSNCVIKGPKDPDGVAQRIADRLNCLAAVVDVNDVGGSWALGASRGVDRPTVEAAMKDNPLGQGDEQTPVGIIRRVAADKSAAA